MENQCFHGESTVVHVVLVPSPFSKTIHTCVHVGKEPEDGYHSDFRKSRPSDFCRLSGRSIQILQYKFRTRF